MNKDMVDMYFANHADGKNFGSIKDLFTSALLLGVADESGHWKARMLRIAEAAERDQCTVEDLIEELREWGE